ncbi:hypothetical protein [Salininema proteolyticum]|uniref:Uncharacterized protein n=1 Tax=Salininema proteolyticum TaxID=1607685 RepID=A0ABV8U232_9ACTN
MYSWIWRRIPGGVPGKLVGMLGLAAGAFALLWFAVFPAVQPHMPWSNVDPGLSDNGPAGDLAPPQGEDGEDADEDCTPGLTCPDSNFDPEDYETADEEEGRRLQEEYEDNN